MTKTSDPGAALAARYAGLDDATAGSVWSDVIALQLQHRSVRAFYDRPLPPGTLETLIAAGQSASTSSNMQTTSIVAVTDRERLARLTAACRNQPFIETCPLFLCFVADLSRPARIGRRIDADLYALTMLDTFITSATDCGIFGQAVALAAESLGLGICFIGNLKSHPETVARELALPPASVALFGMCIGYPDESRATAVRPRLPQQVVLHRETYSTSQEDAALNAYDQAFARHEAGQKREPMAWTARHRDRFAAADYIGERAAMKTVLHRLGFALE